MQIIINTLLSTITGTIIGYLIKQVKHKNKEDINLKDAVKSMLRSDITNYYYHCMAREYIRQWEKENIIYLYQSYKSLDGNSYVDIIMKDIEDLPVQK